MNKKAIVVIAWLGWLLATPAFGADLSSTPVTNEPLAQTADPRSAKEQGLSSVQSQPELIRLTTLLVGVNRFKQISLGDYEKALLMFATKEAVAKFRNFNTHIWVDTPPKMAWSYFMSSSVHAVAGMGRQQPLVAFYNPWSDVLLITEWRLDADIPRLVDAEMLMGDWLRTAMALDSAPHWLRTGAFAPAALGASVAQSVAHFEELFQRAGDSSWRKQLPILEDRALLTELNYPAVALMLLSNLQNIHDFRTLTKAADPKMAACRRLALDLVRTAVKGQFRTLRNTANETLPETWRLLERLDPKWFRTLEAVAVIKGEDGCLVFLSPVFEAVSSLGLFFRGTKDRLTLRRVDVIDYSGFYRRLHGQGDTTRPELSL